MRSSLSLAWIPFLLVACDSSSRTKLPPVATVTGETVFIDETRGPSYDGLNAVTRLVNLRDLTLVVESTGSAGTFDLVVDYGGDPVTIAYEEQDLPADVGRLEIPVTIPGNAITYWKVTVTYDDYDGHLFVSLRGTVPLQTFPNGTP